MPFKSFKNIQQSCKGSCTNSCESLESLNDGNLGLSTDPNFTSNSNEFIEQFKKATEITKTMEGLHFSTIDLRNKLSKGCINNNGPIIAQVMVGNVTNQGQVRVEIYPPAQSCWREIRGFLHKEMNLQIKSSYNDALSKNDIFPPWAIAFQPLPIWCPANVI